VRSRSLTLTVLTVLTLAVGIPLSPVRDVVVSSVHADTTTALTDSIDVWLQWLSEGQGDSALLDLLDDDPKPTSFDWSANLSTGYDGYVQTYMLALEDTTESISEFEVTLAAKGETRGDADHRWRVEPRVSIGSERTRQQLDLGWKWTPDSGPKLLDATAQVRATQYQGSTDYSLSSDLREGHGRVRWQISPEGAVAGEARLEGRSLRYTDPSALQVHRDDVLAQATLASGSRMLNRWRVGLRAGHRSHPDTAAIDRTTLGLDAETERYSYGGLSWRATLRSEQRTIRDESARPSNWAHWATLDVSTPLSMSLEAVLELEYDAWIYKETRDAYQDQRRWVGLAGLRAPAALGPGWSLGMAWETLESGDPDESYHQLGVRGGLEHYGAAVSGTVTLEVGRRNYLATDDDPSVTGEYDTTLFTDFTYTEVWISGSWMLDDHLGIDALASWLPESHSDDDDDQSLGFASVRVSYRF